MDYIYIHLLLNHIPILGGVFGIILFLVGFFRKNQSLINAGLVSLVIITLVTIPAYLSGEEAEELVEGMAGTSEFYLEEHEEWSEVALWVMVTTGILSLVSLLMSSFHNIRRWLHYLVILASIASIILMVVVGNYGGKIRHSELRENVNGAVNQEKSELKKPDHDDDD